MCPSPRVIAVHSAVAAVSASTSGSLAAETDSFGNTVALAPGDDKVSATNHDLKECDSLVSILHIPRSMLPTL